MCPEIKPPPNEAHFLLFWIKKWYTQNKAPYLTNASESLSVNFRRGTEKIYDEDIYHKTDEAKATWIQMLKNKFHGFQQW